MDDSKTSFGTGSRFSQLPLPRKIALVAVVVLLGYGLADPAFLSDSAMHPAEQIEQQAALEDFLAHIESRHQPASPSADTADVTADVPVTVASARNETGTVQNVSYPEQAIALEDSSHGGEGIAPVADESILILPGTPRNPTSPSAPPKIRLTGTIYPNSL